MSGKVAIVHDWLTGMRGGERVLESVCRLFPNADIYTLIHIKGNVSEEIEGHPIHTSFVQHLPLLERYYRYYLPVFPYAIEQFDLSEYQLVISLSHCVALGVITRPECCHICYCFTPMRYVWDQYWRYFKGGSGAVKGAFIGFVANHLRMWDTAASQRVDSFVTTSAYVAQRIWKYYRRNSVIVHPGINTSYFTPGSKQDDFFLIVSALSPYKRIDLAIEVCNKLQLPLLIIGWGPEEKRLRRLAGPTIQFLGKQPDNMLREYYQRCRALLFPGEEDFGLTPLEAQACGKPVIAYGRGGALETVLPERSGILFERQEAADLEAAIKRFSEMEFNSKLIQEHAMKFSQEQFAEKFMDLVTRTCAAHEQHRMRQEI